MATKPRPPEGWERTPIEAQESIRGLEAREAVLVAMVQRWPATIPHVTEQL